jgi:GntR family transcriptional repressor for pyruvate dehydrogenase complex
MPSSPDARSLGPVASIPAHELVLAQLRRSIHLGHFGAGDKLPPERELAKLLGVSRTTVREAVRVLEGEGLVEIRRGSSGGISVKPQSMGRTELRRRLREFEEIIEFRLALEPMAARLAAQRRTKADIAALHKAFEWLAAIAATGAEGAVSDWVRADGDYHLLIARMARNGRLLNAIEEARAGMFLPIGAVFGRLESRAHLMHAELHDAIVAGDGDRAGAAMTAHVEATLADVRNLVGS